MKISSAHKIFFFIVAIWIGTVGVVEALNPWQKIEASGTAPSQRLLSTAVHHNNSMFVFGGSESSGYKQDVFKLNFLTKEWMEVSTVGSPPSARFKHSTILYEDKMVIFGGEGSGGKVGDLFYFHLKTSTWEEVTASGSAPTAREYHSAVRYNDSMYIFGGNPGTGLKNDFFKFSFTNNTWEEIITTPVEKPTEREQHTAQMFEDLMVVFGGVDSNGLLNDVWILNLTTYSWAERTPSGTMPSERKAHTSIVYKDFMVVFGGFTGSNSYSNEVFTFNLNTNMFTQMSASDTSPSKRGYLPSILYNDKFVVFGGMNAESTAVYYNDVWEKDLSILPCPIPTSGSATITSDCILYNQIVVTGSLNITGVPDAQGNLPKIIGGGSNRLFKVESGGGLVVKFLNLTGGHTTGTFPDGRGGAIFLEAASTGTGLFTAMNCVFYENYSPNFGSAIYIGMGGTGSTVIIRNSSFVKHGAAQVFYIHKNSVLNVEHCQFIQNSATKLFQAFGSGELNVIGGSVASSTTTYAHTHYDTTAPTVKIINFPPISFSGNCGGGDEWCGTQSCTEAPTQCEDNGYPNAICTTRQNPNEGVICAQNCSAGYHKAGTFNHTCEACSSGAYNSLWNRHNCLSWTNCSSGQYIATNGTSTADRVCTPCGNGTYSASANAFSCTAWTNCVAGQKIAANGTATTDRTCEACPTGKFSTASNQNTCTNWTACNATIEIESSAGSTTADRVCALAGSPSPSPGDAPSPAADSPSPASNTSTTDVPNKLSAAHRYRPSIHLYGVLMASTWFGMERRLRFTMLRLFLFASFVGAALAAEWNCTSANPEAAGTFNCTQDCTMTSAGVQLTANLSITGRPEMTTITAKTTGDRRHFYVELGWTLTLKWLNLTGGSMSGSYPNDRGGSIYVKDTGSTLHATSCVFFLNTATYGGGVFNNEGSTVVHDDSIIAENRAGRQGGGIWQQYGSVTITRSLIRDNRQTTSGGIASNGGGGVYISMDAVGTIRESTFDQNHAEGTNKGHQIMAFKRNSQGGAPAVTVVNTKFNNSGVTAGTNFYLYDDDDSSNSGADKYGTFSRKTCSDSPCTVAPFIGACTDRTDDANYGVTCAYSSCGGGTYGTNVTVSQSSLPPVATCTAHSTSCNAGFLKGPGSATADTCEACPTGQYQSAINFAGSSCNSCAAGAITNTGVNTGATICTACTAGKYSTASNVASCTPWTNCSAGQYIATNGTSRHRINMYLLVYMIKKILICLRSARLTQQVL